MDVSTNIKTKNLLNLTQQHLKRMRHDWGELFQELFTSFNILETISVIHHTNKLPRKIRLSFNRRKIFGKIKALTFTSDNKFKEVESEMEEESQHQSSEWKTGFQIRWEKVALWQRQCDHLQGLIDMSLSSYICSRSKQSMFIYWQ